MFCPKCGSQNSDTAGFCASCGNTLNPTAGSGSAYGSAPPPPPPNRPPVGGVPPKNWLVESILVTIFCCLPFGVVGIINASKVESLFAQGNHDGAQKAAAEAAKWTKIGFFVGIAVIGLYLLFWVVMGVGANL